MHALQAGASHQAFDPTMAHGQVLAEQQLGVHPAMPEGAVGGDMDVADGVHQVGLFPGPVAGRAGVLLVEAGGRDLQDLAGRRDGNPVRGELADDREEPGRSGVVSPAAGEQPCVMGGEVGGLDALERSEPRVGSRCNRRLRE